MAFPNQFTSSKLVLILLLCASCGSTTQDQIPTEEPLETPTSGKALYAQNCVACHGNKGNLGLSGAKDLTKTTLEKSDIRTIISEGKGSMPAFKELFSNEELDSLTAHLLTFKK